MKETSWYAWILEHFWVAEVVIVLAGLLFLNFLLKKLIFRSKAIAHFKENDWRSHLDYAALAPARALLWLLLAFFLIELIDREAGLGGLFSFAAPLRNAGIVLSLSWFLLRWRKVFHNAIASRRSKGKLTFDPVSLEIIGKIFTIAVVFVSLLIILQIFGLDIVPLMTFGGIGVAAMGIASKDVIANFFGGLMIYVTRPFTAGDLIELPQKKIIGHVEEIGWYLTSVRDQQKKPIYIPNSIFSTELLINLSRRTHRRIEEVIQIRSDDVKKVFPIIEKIRTFFEHHSEIDHNQTVHVFFKAFGSYSLDIEVEAYTLSTRYEEFMEIKQKILLEIYDIVVKSGADMPYPTSYVILEKN
jgi:MscS family membrane protein